MLTKSEEKNRIKEKSEFIFNHSGLIYYKLFGTTNFYNLQIQKNENIVNVLQTLLLSDASLEELEDVCGDLMTNPNKQNFINRYEYALAIIFEICRLVNQSTLQLVQKEALRDKLRQYPKYFKIQELTDLTTNKKYINFSNHPKEYQKRR